MSSKKLLQIEICQNTGSTGRIAENVAKLALSQGWDCYQIHGSRFNNPPSCMKDYQVGSVLEDTIHYLKHYFFDLDGLSSHRATKKAVSLIKEIKPDVIQLHDIHDHWLNYKILFEYLGTTNIPVVWTQHDCWAFTGGCGHFSSPECFRWRDGTCGAGCPQRTGIRKLFEKTRNHYLFRKNLLRAVNSLTIVSVSYWMEELIRQSFLKDKQILTIQNGIDISLFRPCDCKVVREKYGIGNDQYIIGVSSQWLNRKGWADFLKLSNLIPNNVKIVLIGVTPAQKKEAQNKGIIGVLRTDNIEEMAALYSGAMMFCNLTYMDTFPTTNLEALACGTPVLTYQTDGSVEAVDDQTGWIVSQGDLENVSKIIVQELLESPQVLLEKRERCRRRAEILFNMNDCFNKYLVLYNELIDK